MALDRRQFLARSGLAVAATAGFSWLEDAPAVDASDEAVRSWAAVRRQFALRADLTHFGTFLLASHPATVRAAIARYRRALDANTVEYLHAHQLENEARVLAAAAAYLGGRPEDVALTDSTTMGLSLLYAGLDVRPGHELLTTTHDFFVTHAALERKARESGATLRRVALYDRSSAASEAQIVERLLAGVTARTRVVAITWVHSSTGVKLPLRRIAEALAPLNAGRDERDRILLCVDGVHGFGVANVAVAQLGCDFFASGCHKWLFGPRGTGLVWGAPRAWPAANPIIPSFSATAGAGSVNTPGGFHSFEHRWALAEAFAFQRRVGKARIASRIHALNRQLKEELAAMSHVTLYTPRSTSLSAGLVCFDIDRLSPDTVVRRLRDRRIVATTTPYSPSYARVGPGILNTPAEVRRTLEAIQALR